MDKNKSYFFYNYNKAYKLYSIAKICNDEIWGRNFFQLKEPKYRWNYWYFIWIKRLCNHWQHWGFPEEAFSWKFWHIGLLPAFSLWVWTEFEKKNKWLYMGLSLPDTLINLFLTQHEHWRWTNVKLQLFLISSLRMQTMIWNFF